VLVPVSLQAELLSKVAAYDKALAGRAGGRVRVVVLSRLYSAESAGGAARLSNAIAQLTDIAGMPHEVSVLPFTTGGELATKCRTSRVSVVYVTPGFSDEIGSIAKALSGVDVLTVSALASDVPKGVVLGFDLVSGKPKLLVHLAQARAQKVAFRPELLKLAKVYE
jgi:hypothetical protein